MVLVPMDATEFEGRWPALEKLGCSCETTHRHTSYGHRQLYSVDVPPEADIDAVRALLDEGDRDGAWIFQDGHIDHRPASPTARKS